MYSTRSAIARCKLNSRFSEVAQIQNQCWDIEIHLHSLHPSHHMYLFDTSDSCVYTAHLLEYDLTELESIFISHPHIDHVGRFPYLFLLLHKFCRRRSERHDRILQIYIPSAKPVVAALAMNDNRLDANALILFSYRR